MKSIHDTIRTCALPRLSPGVECRFSTNAHAARAVSPVPNRGTQLASLLPHTAPRRLDGPGSRRLKMVVIGFGSDNPSVTICQPLLRELAARGHDVLFLEPNPESPIADGNLPPRSFARTECYHSIADLKDRFAEALRHADFILVGSPVADGIAIGEWVTRIAQGVTAFYDLDTPVTLAKLRSGCGDSLSPELISRYHLYLSFTGGPLLEELEQLHHLRMVRPLYGSVDAMAYFPEERPLKWDLGFLGSWHADGQSLLETHLMEPARNWSRGRFVVAGSEYPRATRWSKNVKRFKQVAPGRRRGFYTSQKFTLHLARPTQLHCGFAPSPRLLEAAACATPIITNGWDGLEAFFTPGKEILVTRSSAETLEHLQTLTEIERRQVGYRAREAVLARHTSRQRAQELESYILELLKLQAA
jgi:spore maturation protein CgeB